MESSQRHNTDRDYKRGESRVKLAHLVSTAQYSFKPIMLKEYYLYKKNVLYRLTLISPEEWPSHIECPYGECVAVVRQLGDSTWEEII